MYKSSSTLFVLQKATVCAAIDSGRIGPSAVSANASDSEEPDNGHYRTVQNGPMTLGEDDVTATSRDTSRVHSGLQEPSAFLDPNPVLDAQIRLSPSGASLARASCDSPRTPIWIGSGGQSCLKIDLFSGDGVGEFQILGVQEISSIAGEAGEIFKRLAG